MAPVYAALIAATCSIILSMGTIIFNASRSRRFDPERVLADFQVVELIKRLLSNPKGPYRTFAILRHHVGGYSDDELRKLLVRAGAIRVIAKDDREMWILLSRMIEVTGNEHEFVWYIDKVPNTPSDDRLFPAKLKSRSA